ncbi:MAG: hypothetical protein P8Y70_18840, partial [Candidatus Lokiarchaeota archaeon]
FWSSFSNSVLLSLLISLFAFGIKTIDSTIGKAPIIDGSLHSTSDEWDGANTYTIMLNNTSEEDGLPITLGIIQNDNHLYIYIQYNIEAQYHSQTEFFGLIISKNSSYERNDFVDAKILQFENISTDTYKYLDYYINQSTFYQDTEVNGEGAAKIVSQTSTYEFSLPIDNVEANNSGQDVYLKTGSTYAFNLTYGESPVYPGGIIKYNTVEISIKQKPSSLIQIDYNFVLRILSYIIFTILGVLFGYYIYRIVILKRQIERIKG